MLTDGDFAETANTRHDGRSKISALTGVRGIAACWVAMFHFCITLSQQSIFPGADQLPILNRGYLGVDLFFFLSGYVLTLTYGSEMATFSWSAIRRFWIGRVWRILPLNTFVLFMTLPAVLLLPDQDWGHGPYSWPSYLASLVLLQSWFGWAGAWNPSAWSLSVEWFAYALFTFLIAPIQMLKNPIVLSILAVAVLIPLGGMVAHGSQHTLSHAEGLGFIRCTCEFISGALLSLLYKHKSPPNLPGDIALLLGTIFLSLSLFGGYIELMALPGFSLILMSCATNSGMSKILLGNRVIYTLGEISFSLYMIHRFIFTLAKAMSFGMGPSVTIFIMLSALLAIFPLAWGAWRFIELPGQAFGRRFSRRSGGVKIN